MRRPAGRQPKPILTLTPVGFWLVGLGGGGCSGKSLATGMGMAEYAVETVWNDFERWEWVTFPEGSRIIYIEVPEFPEKWVHHSYWRVNGDGNRGTRLASASKLFAFPEDPERLIEWNVRQALEGEDRNHARDRGARVHGVAEALANGSGFPNVDEMPETDRGYAQALMRWWEQKDPQVLACEQFVYHGAYSYAGRYDLRARIGGVETLIDYKTSKSLSSNHGAQLAAYDCAAEWCGLGRADELLVLKLCENGDFFEVPAFVSPERFHLAMENRAEGKRVERAMNNWIKAAA